MDKIKTAINFLIERRELLSDLNSYDLKKQSDLSYIYQFEAINAVSDIENYLIYDTIHSKKISDYLKFDELLNECNSQTDIFFIPVMIFYNWDDENRFYKHIFESLKKSNQRKRLKQLFEIKISIYIELDDEISINVLDEINYLEYFDNKNFYDSNMKGYI